MKNLYESLLADFEDIEKEQDINFMLINIDELACYDDKFSTKPPKSNSYFKGSTLILADCEQYIISDEVINKLSEIKKIHPFDYIQCQSDLTFYYNDINDKNFAKYVEIKGRLRLSGFGFGGVSNIENINFKINPQHNGQYCIDEGYIRSLPTRFENCEIECGVRRSGDCKFNFVPIFKNCKFKNIMSIVLDFGGAVKTQYYSKLISSMLDQTYQTQWKIVRISTRASKKYQKGDVITNVMDWDFLKTVINTPSSFKFNGTKDDKYFQIDPKFKLSDIIDGSSLEDVGRIIMIFDNISVTFFPKNSSILYDFKHDPQYVELPNDNWVVKISKI